MISNYLEQFKSTIWEDSTNRCVDMTTEQVFNQKSISQSQIDKGKNYER